MHRQFEMAYALPGKALGFLGDIVEPKYVVEKKRIVTPENGSLVIRSQRIDSSPEKAVYETQGLLDFILDNYRGVHTIDVAGNLEHKQRFRESLEELVFEAEHDREAAEVPEALGTACSFLRETMPAALALGLGIGTYWLSEQMDPSSTPFSIVMGMAGAGGSWLVLKNLAASVADPVENWYLDTHYPLARRAREYKSIASRLMNQL